MSIQRAIDGVNGILKFLNHSLAALLRGIVVIKILWIFVCA
jgi:hypothetical protein